MTSPLIGFVRALFAIRRGIRTSDQLASLARTPWYPDEADR